MRPSRNQVDQMENGTMRKNTTVNKSSSLLPRRPKLALMMLLIACCSQLTLAQQPQAKTFASASQAVQALYDAVRNNDESAVDFILGLGSTQGSKSGDADDKINHDRFVKKYQVMHRLVQEQDGTTMLYIGAENWPFPFPLISEHRKWHFDSDVGSQEVQAREIGSNEVTAIQVLQAFQKTSGPDSAMISKPDLIQDFAAVLKSREDSATSNERGPFHGYYFRTLSGKAGEALIVAYPVEYRSSGVMTFVITSGGSVYEKDLGPDSSKLAQQVQGNSCTDWVAVQQ